MEEEGSTLGNDADGEIHMSKRGEELMLSTLKAEEVIRNVHGNTVKFLCREGSLEG